MPRALGALVALHLVVVWLLLGTAVGWTAAGGGPERKPSGERRGFELPELTPDRLSL